MFAGNNFLNLVALWMVLMNSVLFMLTFAKQAADHLGAEEDPTTLFCVRMLFVLNVFGCLPGAFS